MNSMSDPKKIDPRAIDPNMIAMASHCVGPVPMSAHATPSSTAAPTSPNRSDVSMIPKRYWRRVNGPTKSCESMP